MSYWLWLLVIAQNVTTPTQLPIKHLPNPIRTTHVQVIDTTHIRRIDTIGVVLPQEQPAWVVVLQVIASLATLATIPAAIAAWKAAAAARDSAQSSAQQTNLSLESWKAQKEEAVARQQSLDLRLKQYAEAGRQKVEALLLEAETTRQAGNDLVGWFRGFNEEVKSAELMLRELLMSTTGTSPDKEELARAAYRSYFNAASSVGTIVRLTASLTDVHQPQGGQAVGLCLATYREHLKKCVDILTQLVST